MAKGEEKGAVFYGVGEADRKACRRRAKKSAEKKARKILSGIPTKGAVSLDRDMKQEIYDLLLSLYGTEACRLACRESRDPCLPMPEELFSLLQIALIGSDRRFSASITAKDVEKAVCNYASDPKHEEHPSVYTLTEVVTGKKRPPNSDELGYMPGRKQVERVITPAIRDMGTLIHRMAMLGENKHLPKNERLALFEKEEKAGMKREEKAKRTKARREEKAKRAKAANKTTIK